MLFKSNWIITKTLYHFTAVTIFNTEIMIFWSTAIAKILQQLLNSKQMIPVCRKLGGKYGKKYFLFQWKKIFLKLLRQNFFEHQKKARNMLRCLLKMCKIRPYILCLSRNTLHQDCRKNSNLKKKIDYFQAVLETVALDDLRGLFQP